MKKILAITVLFFTTITFSQQKRLWAKSFINKKAPEIVVGEWLTDAPETKGKFVLIDFWATWCAPCKRLIPELNHFQKKFKNDLVVIGISDEKKSKVTGFKKHPIEYYSAIDTKKKLKNIYQVKGIPHCVIINPEGIVVWEGWPQLEGHELTAEVIEDLIKKG